MFTNLTIYHPMAIMLNMSAAYWQSVFEMQSSILRACAQGPTVMAADTDDAAKPPARSPRRTKADASAPVDDEHLPV